MNQPATFQTGETYSCRLPTDYNAILSFTVISRTAKFITISKETREGFPPGEPNRIGILSSDQGEWARPCGNYSLCPAIQADRPQV